MSWEKNVFSSMVTSVGYDPEKAELYVTWSKSGKTSVYAGVPEGVALDLSNAPSVGQMVNMEIKPYYQHLGYK